MGKRYDMVLFDDWDYYEALRDRADESSEDKDSDNVLRQRRKMMKQIYSIGLSGDEFCRLVYEMLTYALEITESMHTKAAGWDTTNGRSGI